MIVWLASYPRSGNTLCRIIFNHVFKLKTYSIYNDVHDIGADIETAEIVGHEPLPVDFDLKKARASKELCLIKTHGLPTTEMRKDKIIYLIRDGRESSVSFHRYLNDLVNHPCDLDNVLVGDCPFGSWSEHVQTWRYLHPKRIMWVGFERLRNNPEHYIAAISKFLEIEPVTESFPGFQELQKLNPLFFRSGQLNSWRKVLSRNQIRLFEILHYRILVDYRYKVSVNERDIVLANGIALQQDKVIQDREGYRRVLAWYKETYGDLKNPVDDTEGEIRGEKLNVNGNKTGAF